MNKIHQQLKTWLEYKSKNFPQYTEAFDIVLQKLDKLNKEKNKEKLKQLTYSLCQHEWISDLSEKELNAKHNIIFDYGTNLPTEKRWDYGYKLCKNCGMTHFDYFCPNNAPSHDCEYDRNGVCKHCGLPDERK